MCLNLFIQWSVSKYLNVTLWTLSSFGNTLYSTLLTFCDLELDLWYVCNYKILYKTYINTLLVIKDETSTIGQVKHSYFIFLFRFKKNDWVTLKKSVQTQIKFSQSIKFILSAHRRNILSRGQGEVDNRLFRN